MGWKLRSLGQKQKPRWGEIMISFLEQENEMNMALSIQGRMKKRKINQIRNKRGEKEMTASWQQCRSTACHVTGIRNLSVREGKRPNIQF